MSALKLTPKPIDNKRLCESFERIEAVRQLVQLTWYEFSTLAILLCLKEANLDVVILEVGVGGRGDVVNLMNTDLAILTNISLDHCQWFGDSRESIGEHKSGIFRAGKPVITAEADLPQSVLDQATELQSLILQADITCEDERWSISGFDSQPYPNLPLGQCCLCIIGT